MFRTTLVAALALIGAQAAELQAMDTIDTTLTCDGAKRKMAEYDYLQDAWRYGYGHKKRVAQRTNQDLLYETKKYY